MISMPKINDRQMALDEPCYKISISRQDKLKSAMDFLLGVLILAPIHLHVHLLIWIS